MLDWKLAMQEERAALQRIVVLLFAFADLAERTQRRSRPVRRFVVWILRRAETLAREYVLGPVESRSSGMSVDLLGGAEAMRLARDFRSLALELARQAKLAFAVPARILHRAGQAGLARFGACRAPDAAGLPTVPRLAAAKIARRLACTTGPPDTS